MASRLSLLLPAGRWWGGGGEGTAPGGEGTGTGAGVGFGVIVRPVGAYFVKDGAVSWQPAIDMTRVVLGGHLLGLAAVLPSAACARGGEGELDDTLEGCVRHRGSRQP
jgi:hypothetical protein